MEEQGLSVPKVHDLEELRAQLLPRYPELRSARRGLVFLTTFAVAARYPGLRTQKRTAKSAVRWAGQIRELCRRLLGIQP